jgi:hypothetical protein
VHSFDIFQIPRSAKEEFMLGKNLRKRSKLILLPLVATVGIAVSSRPVCSATITAFPGLSEIEEGGRSTDIIFGILNDGAAPITLNGFVASASLLGSDETDAIASITQSPAPVAPPQIRFTQGAVLPIGASALLILTVAPVAFGDEEENRDLGDWKITTTVGYTDAGVVKTVQGTAEVFVTDPVVPEPGSTGLVLIGGGTFWLMRAMRGLRRGDSMSSGNSYR